jgi:hypothetical protein
MDNHIPGALILTVVVLVLAACAAAPSASPTQSLPFTELPHDAPELEAVLPRSIQGRPIATWSMAGLSWPSYAADQPPHEAERLINEDVAAVGGNPINFDNLGIAIGGRTDTETDPPYFVWVAKRPVAEEEIELTMFLMFSGAGFVDPAGADDLDRYDKRTIGREAGVRRFGRDGRAGRPPARPTLALSERRLSVHGADRRRRLGRGGARRVALSQVCAFHPMHGTRCSGTPEAPKRRPNDAVATV